MYLDLSQEIPANVYKLFIGSVVPRPIAWVSSVNEAGLPNLAPFSYFNIASINPPILSFSPLNAPSAEAGKGRRKDTLVNVRATGECVIHVVPHALQDEMNLSAIGFPPHISEFDFIKLHTAPALHVKAPRLLAAPIAFECKVDQIVSWGDQPMGGNVVFCRVLGAHVNEAIVQDFKTDVQAFDPIGRLGGADYVRVTAGVYPLPRPEDLLRR